MNNNDNTSANIDPSESKEANLTRQSAEMRGDIHDSPEDEEKMKAETVILDLPEVSDIPGQENIVIPTFGEMQDTTISSDDEEGFGLFGDDDGDEDNDLVMGNEADVTAAEVGLLSKADENIPVEDDLSLREAELDETDNEGELLNEGSLSTDVSGGDLDTSGIDSDDPMEAIGEEDEENSTYSLGSDSNDEVAEATP